MSLFSNTPRQKWLLPNDESSQTRPAHWSVWETCPRPSLCRHSIEVTLSSAPQEEDTEGDVGLQLKVNFPDKAVQRNARLAGKWGPAENTLSFFPFAAGESFKVKRRLTAEPGSFQRGCRLHVWCTWTGIYCMIHFAPRSLFKPSVWTNVSVCSEREEIFSHGSNARRISGVALEIKDEYFVVISSWYHCPRVGKNFSHLNKH